MSDTEFLEGILPEGTRYSLRIIRKSDQSTANKFFNDIESMANAVDGYVNDGYNVYYATAGFGAGQRAISENAVAKRELYVDVDCGQGKSYPDKSEGAQALKTFCKTMGMPMPTIVDSGNGLHAHWIFESSVPVHEWLEVANNLKWHCKDKQFDVDAACTADTVRVLRIPGTINRKNNTPVSLLTPIRYYSFEKLSTLLERPRSRPTSIAASADAADIVDIAEIVKRAPRPSSALVLTKSLAGWDPNRVSVFQTIWLKSVKGTGCAQIQNAIENAELISEPVWRGALSIAAHCEDRDWGIHALSKDHPNYSPEETEQKASGTKGPYTCETFQGLETSAFCRDCKHLGKITSPIQLGSDVKTTQVPVQVKVADRTLEIPVFPEPYERGRNGGVYMRVTTDDGSKVEQIYPYDLYVYKRMRDAEMGDVVWLRHHLPNDAVRDFMIAQREVGAIEKFRDKLNEQGVAVFVNAHINRLQSYVAASIQALQHKEKADEMYTRFGWTRNKTFIVGDREYTKIGVIHAPVSRSLEKYVQWFTPKGDLEEWKRIVAMYNDPRFDLHALGVLFGFGSTLMAMSPENGAVVNYYSKRSGTGKTTILRAINSIFGDPKAMMKDAQDTHLTKVHRMGVLNGIAMCLDEMTNVTPQEISNLLYGSTQGRARDRMEAGKNAERYNDLTWKQMSIWSMNTVIEDRLSMIKMDPQGELARTIEIHLRTPVPSDVLESQKLFNKLSEHYGVAGDVFLRYVVPNFDEVQGIWDETRDIVYAKNNWTQTERYKLNAVICAIAAGVVTNNLGLTSFNLKRIARVALKLVSDTQVELAQKVMGAVETVATFVNHNVGNMLSIDAHKRTAGLQNTPYVKPKGSLIIRYEPDTKSLFIAQKDFNKWCAENYMNTREIPGMFESETGQRMDVVKKRMGAGWDTDFGAVNAYLIKNANKVLGFEDNVLVQERPEDTAS